MAYKRFRIFVSKGWTLLVCSLSIAVLALMSSCRSKKLNKSAEPDPAQEEQTDQDADNPGSVNDYTPMATLPGDSKEVRKKIEEVNTLKDELSTRMNTVIYGPPAVMERRARENSEMREKIDRLSKEINDSRKK
ncbi:MAG: hypothetical protein J6X21_04480 [Bacteroidaceae bacterium]|jgi:hypothetical protein|nr:hypothetical protein [Bacteroidaceae bacterium]